jgi:hypothetical protein
VPRNGDIPLGIFLVLEASQPCGKRYRLGLGCVFLHPTLASMLARSRTVVLSRRAPRKTGRSLSFVLGPRCAWFAVFAPDCAGANGGPAVQVIARAAMRGADYVLLVRPMKNAIGTLGRCLSELDISRRRLTLLSWMPLDGKTQEIRASPAGIRAFFIAA